MPGVQNPQNLTGANTFFEAAYMDVFGTNAVTTVADLICRQVPSSTLTTELVGAAETAEVREWLGQKIIQNLMTFRQSVPFRKFEHTFGLPRPLVEYDNIGVVQQVISEGLARGRQKHELVVFNELISNSGNGPTGFDSSNLISTTHAMYDGSNQSNKSTSALEFSTFDAASVAMRSFVGHNGAPLDIIPDTLIVGPKLMKIAKDIAGSPTRPVSVDNTGTNADAGQSLSSTVAALGTRLNVYQGSINVIEWPRLRGTQDDYWYLCCLNRPSKPMNLVVQKDFTPVYKDKDTDDNVFIDDQYVYSITADMSPAAGAWPYIFAGIL